MLEDVEENKPQYNKSILPVAKSLSGVGSSPAAQKEGVLS